MKTLLVLISFIICKIVFCQESLKRFMDTNIVSIGTSAHNLDFKQVGEAIGERRFVFLGEQDHGDLTTFEVKASLVKYLHDSLGFNILAFEGDFFALNYQTSAKKDLRFYKNNIMSVWSDCAFYEDFVEANLIQRKERRLILTGFDSQFTGEITYRYFQKYLDSLILSSKLMPDKKTLFISEINKNLDTNFWNYKMDSFQCKATINFCNKLFEELDTLLLNRFDYLNILNLKQRATSLLLMQRNSPFFNTVRDLQMANNFKYLSDSLFKDQKIIIWTHTGHFLDLIETNQDGNYLKNMGQFLFDSLKFRKNSYLIVFSSQNGKYGIIRSDLNHIKSCKYECLEDYIPKKIKFGFVNFVNYNLNDGNIHTYRSHVLEHKCMLKNWKNAYDGLIYIKTMYPCTSGR